jgi:hypothetical protein
MSEIHELAAYPTSHELYGGLTKREVFAMAAMQGLLSNLAEIRREGFKDHEIEEFAVMRADALLAELAKEAK